MSGFTIRQEFQTKLVNLGVKQSVLKGLKQYCIKYSSNSLDLFHCILERIHSQPFLNRINYFYLLECCCIDEKDSKLLTLQFSANFRKLFYKNFDSILDGLLPCDPLGLINLSNVKKTVKLLRSKNAFSDKIIDEMEQKINCRNFRETKVLNIPKEDIWKKIEEDRERNKWYKEENWTQKYDSENNEKEFDDLLDAFPDVEMDTFLEDLEKEHATYVLDCL
ncbi:hypothetical protein K502DRAFT_332630 [Neoconidiobolus thromboides FSU 785]|nr:hypothetical protein K502DRAFT_332630 [Neoconidiobolus thromboides FSU 785]